MPPETEVTATDKQQPFLARLYKRLGVVGALCAAIFLVFLVAVLIILILEPVSSERYIVLKDLHRMLSRAGLMVAGVMLAAAVYIGLIKHGDVTPWFRRVTYTIVAFITLEGALGGLMYLMGGRPGEDVHMIYGYGVVLSLPFFIFVEVTAKKRPAMGSYIWGYTMLAAIIVRCISTGPPG